MIYEGEFWFCDAIGEAWDTELHDETPCAKAQTLYGDDGDEHGNCGPAEIRKASPDA